MQKMRGKIAINPVPPLPSKNEQAIRHHPGNQPPSRVDEDMRFKEYKVIEVMEGGCGTLLVGSSKIPVLKMEAALNEAAIDGWQVVFQVIEAKRFLLFWTRESIIITLGR